MNIIDDVGIKEACKDTLCRFLAQLGKVLIKEPGKARWLNVKDICTFCRERELQLDGTYPTVSLLEPALRQLFERRQQICMEDICMVGFLSTVKSGQVFVLRFSPDLFSKAVIALGSRA